MLGIVIAGLIVTGMLRVHALNPFLVLGFPSALYAGFFTGAVLGGIVGVLIDFVVKRDANIHHDDELREGDAVVVVHAWDNESVKEISTILNDSHAKLITIVKNSNFYSTDPATSEPGENTTMSNVRNKVQEKTEQNAYLLDKAKNAENDLLRKSSGIPASIPDQLDEVLLKRSKEIGSWIGKTGVRIKAFGETLHQIGEGISHLHERLKSDQKERSSSDSTPEKDFH